MEEKIVIERMDEARLLDLVRRSVQDSRDFIYTGLQENWKMAQKYYFGDKLGNEKEGKSQVISRDMSDAVDWMLPSLMDIFCGSKEAVLFEPQTEDDVLLAEQATAYCNYIFYRKNNGFNVAYTWMKDALMFKRGIAKVYWEERTELVTELYNNLSEFELELLLTEDNAQLVELTENVEQGSLDVKINKEVTKSQIKVSNVKPENFIIDRHATSVEDATIVGQQERLSISDLRAMGCSEELIEVLKSKSEIDPELSPLAVERESFNKNFTTAYMYDDMLAGEANEKVWVVEVYMRVDYDGDGIAELRRIVYSGNTIISNDDWDNIPYVTICPNPIQHTFYGQSVFDQIKDIQDIKTTLLRNQLDNMYLTNNGRHVVVEGQVNLQDLQNNRSGGIIREKMQNAIRPLVQPQLPQGAYDMLGYMDELKTNRTGVSARSQGLDDKILNSHTGQGQVNKVMSVAEQRLKLIARIFAETGYRDLFLKMYQLSMKYQKQDEIFRLNGKFISVNPSKWKDRTDMEIVVGLGTNDKDQQLMHLTRLLETQKAIVNSGGMNILTNQEKIYNTLVALTENAGYKNVEKFWLDPTTPEAQQAIQAQMKAQSKPKPEEIKANADMMKQQSEAQLNQVRVQMDMTQKQSEQQTRQSEMLLKERELALKEREMALKEAIQELEDRKFEWEKQVNIAEAFIEAKQKRAAGIGDGKA